MAVVLLHGYVGPMVKRFLFTVNGGMSFRNQQKIKRDVVYKKRFLSVKFSPDDYEVFSEKIF